MNRKGVHYFEASWEVCNKVGGIHTVLTSKMRSTLAEFPDHYYALGPWFNSGSFSEFNEEALPAHIQNIANQIAEFGIKLHYGSWLIPGKPQAILIDTQDFTANLNQLKASLWETYKLDTLGSNFYDLDQPLLWSTAVGIFLAAYAATHKHQVLFQGHEWMTGGAFLHLDTNHSQVKTIFTTHATVMGRALSSRGINVTTGLQNIDIDTEAKALGVGSKHQLEKLAAREATVFTTVSQVTAEEASTLLGQTPILTENGLDIENFPTFDQLSFQKRQIRQHLEDFTAAYFFPSYSFDLNQASYYFSMGRYEIHNKGYDLFLESLGELNKRLQKIGSKKTVVTFLLVPGDAGPLLPESISKMTSYRQVQRLIGQATTQQQRNWYGNIMNGSSALHPNSLRLEIDPELEEKLYQLQAFSPTDKPNPPISPYLLRQGGSDGLIQAASTYGLLNRLEDRVKVVFLPVYLNGFDGLFNLPLYDLVSGFDLGVFPSFYEPWGYTPMESMALGVPAVTSNLAGFGRALQDISFSSDLKNGYYVLDRKNNDTTAMQKLVAIFEKNLHSSSREFTNQRIAAYQTSENFSWQRLYSQYQTAFDMALAA